MHRQVLKVVVLLVAIALVGVAAHGPQAGAGLVISGYETGGKTVYASVTNRSGAALSGTVRAMVVRDGHSYKAAAAAKVPAGQTVTVSIVVGTITDDINPLDTIYLRTITDDIDPLDAIPLGTITDDLNPVG